MLRRERKTALMIALLLAVIAVLLGWYFMQDADIPGVTLADQVSAGDSAAQAPPQNPMAHVEITVENVQDVIATLARPEHYVRQISKTRYWDGGASFGTTTAEIWTTPEALRIRWADGNNMLITEEAYHLWFGGGAPITRPVTAALGESLDRILDRLQGIPSYETVLELDIAQIISADYIRRTLDGEVRYTIRVAVETGLLGYINYYYICLSTGLLIETATFDGEIPVYRLETLRLTIATPEAGYFLLPS